MESMGVASVCGCKEVYRFPHITYAYSSCICSFLQQHPYFLFIFFIYTEKGISINYNNFKNTFLPTFRQMLQSSSGRK